MVANEYSPDSATRVNYACTAPPFCNPSLFKKPFGNPVRTPVSQHVATIWRQPREFEAPRRHKSSFLSFVFSVRSGMGNSATNKPLGVPPRVEKLTCSPSGDRKPPHTTYTVAVSWSSHEASISSSNLDHKIPAAQKNSNHTPENHAAANGTPDFCRRQTLHVSQGTRKNARETPHIGLHSCCWPSRAPRTGSSVVTGPTPWPRTTANRIPEDTQAVLFSADFRQTRARAGPE